MLKTSRYFWSKLLLILTTIYLLPSYAGAADDFWAEMENHANNEAARSKAMNLVGGPLALFFQVVFVIGLGILLLAVIFIAINAGKGFLGKGGITKPVMKLFITGLIVGILCTSGGWLGLFKATQDLAVKPASDILTNGDKQSDETQSDENPKPTEKAQKSQKKN